MPARRALRVPSSCCSLLIVALLATLASPHALAQSPTRWTLFGKQKAGTVTELAPGAAGRVWATTKTAGLFRSDDGAARWNWIEPVPGLSGFDLDPSWACGEIRAIASSPTDPDTAYAATPQTVLRTEDGGATWEPIKISKTIEVIAISPSDPEVVYLSNRRQVWRTDDGGDTWRKASRGLAGNMGYIYSLTIDPNTPFTVYAATGKGSFRSTDGGQSWIQSRGLSSVELVRIVIDPDDPAVLYGAERFDNVWKSVDQGLTWTRLAAFANSPALTDLEFDPFSPGALYLTANYGTGGAPDSLPTGRVLRSFDRGTTWTPVLTTELIHDLDFDPQQAGRAYVATELLGVLKSDDSGVTWTPANEGLTAGLVVRLTPDPLNQGNAFTCTLAPMDSSTTKLVIVTPVDDPPTAVTDAATVNEDSGPNAIDVLANDTDPDGGPISIVSVTQPANGTVVITGGGTGLTYAPNANYCNLPPGMTPDVFTYTLAPGGSSTTVSVLVNCINDPPVADNDAFDFIGNTELRVDLGAATTPHALETTPSTFGALDGDSDPVENNPITISSITVGACTDNTAPFTCTVAGFGTITMEANGRFSFVPAPGDAGATETFQYTISDGQPVNSTATGTVTLTRFERVWYVKNDAPAGGLGRSSDPFDTLAEAQTASLANDYIFVYFGDGSPTGQSAGIALKNGQHLIGQHAGLSLPVNLNANGAPTNLVAPAPGSRPLLDDTVVDAIEGVTATNVIPAEIVGLNLAGNVNAIDWNTNAAFAGTGTFSIRENVIRSAGADGVDMNLAGTGAVNLAFHDNVLIATGTGLDIQETGTGTLTITRFDDNVVNGNTGGSGIIVSNAFFDAIPGGGLNTVDGGIIVIGAPGNGVGGAGLALGNVQGDLHFTSNLNIFADGGAGLTVGGTGVGMQLRVNSGGAPTGIIEATGGAAVAANAIALDLRLTSLRSTNSASAGVSLTNVSGTFSAESGSSITNATGTDFAISGGTANVTYGGTIMDDVGQLVSISGATAGTKSFTGAITDGNDGDGSGISLTGNTGATISFSGGVVLSTGGNPAFAATGGGTLRVTGSANTIVTTTGTALNVAGTTIHADDLTFRSISSNGAASGIILNNTGALGGLTVSGTGAAGTGGTIQNTTSHAISLINARDVVLNWMSIQDPADSGVFGDELTNFTINNSVINGAGDTTVGDEAGLQLEELLGTSAINNTTVSNSFEDNIRMLPSSGVLTNLAITGSTIGPNPVGTGGNGLTIVGDGTADVTLTVTGTTFTGNQTAGFLTTFTDSSQHDITITNSTFTGNTIGIQLSSSLSSDLDFDISSNTFLNHVSHAILIVPGSTATNAAQVVGTIASNIIGNGAADSGSRDGYGIRLDMRGDATATVAITSNTIRNTDIEGIFVESRLDNDADAEVGHLDLTLRDNDSGRPDDNSAFPFGAVYGTRVEARNTTVLCLDLAGNDAENVGAFEDIRLRQRDTATFRLERFVGNGAIDTAVEGFVTGQNPLIDNADATHATTFTGVANGFCAKP